MPPMTPIHPAAQAAAITKFFNMLVFIAELVSLLALICELQIARQSTMNFNKDFICCQSLCVT